MAEVRPADAAERPFCYDCFRPRDGCVCRTITPVDNRTPVLIVQHPRERFHPLGTVRLARRALSRIRVAIWGDTFAQQASWLDEPLPAGAALLFPSPRARPLDELQPAERPQALVVIDGTWTQARRILRASPALAALRHVCLAPRTPSLYRVRAEPAEHYRSTIEAICGALALLEPDNPAIGGLLRSFTALIDTHLALRQERPNRPYHRVRPRPLLRQFPAALCDGGNRLVALYPELIVEGRVPHPVYLTAYRLADGALFEGLVREGAERTDERHREHMGVGPRTCASWPGEPLAHVREALARFLRPGDVLAAWNQRTLDLCAHLGLCAGGPRASRWGQPSGAQGVGSTVPLVETVLLKAVYCNSTRGACGELHDVVGRHELSVESLPLLGRAAPRLAQTVAVARLLVQRARCP